MLRVPKVACHETCNHRKPDGWYRCNRPAGHTGRHCFSWRFTDGRVRGVWG